MENQNREIFGFSKTMFLQCVVLFLGLCGGLLFSRYIYILTALFTTIICFTKDTNNIYYHLLFSMSFTVVYKLSPSSTSFFCVFDDYYGNYFDAENKESWESAIIFYSSFFVISFIGNEN